MRLGRIVSAEVHHEVLVLVRGPHPRNPIGRQALLVAVRFVLVRVVLLSEVDRLFRGELLLVVLLRCRRCPCRDPSFEKRVRRAGIRTV